RAPEAEQALPGLPRVDLPRHRRRRRAPGDVRPVEAGEADVAVDARDHGVDAELQGRQRRQMADAARAVLVDRGLADAEVLARRLEDRQAGKEVRGLGVVAVALVAVL